MTTFILLYLLKANAALLLFAAAYFALLRRLTFFRLNRFYLLFALLFAAVYPALPVPALLPAEATPTVTFTMVEAAATAATFPVAPASPIDWAMVGVALYAAGAAVLLARLLVQLLSLARLRARSRPASVLGQPVRVLTGEISPFSFGPTIYLNPAQHPGPELAAVLRHELVHVRQWHTVDVLLAQLMQAAAWCNPAAWLLRRAVLDNLEFLAGPRRARRRPRPARLPIQPAAPEPRAGRAFPCFLFHISNPQKPRLYDEYAAFLVGQTCSLHRGRAAGTGRGAGLFGGAGAGCRAGGTGRPTRYQARARHALHRWQGEQCSRSSPGWAGKHGAYGCAEG